MLAKSLKSFASFLTREYPVLIFIVLLGGAIRLALLYAMNFGIESDEAIIGLMAKHIAEGAPWPIFYYGQAYMGSLEAILTALVFTLVGVSNASLKVVPFLSSLLHIVLIYLLAKRFLNRFGSSVTALLAALGPNALILWSTKARGGFIELAVIGTFSLILAIDILRAERTNKLRMLLLGLVLGLGWWVNNQIIFYMAAIGFSFLIFYPLRFGLWNSVRDLFLAMFGFVIGGSPFWYANIFFEPKWSTFEVLFAQQGGQGFLSHFQGFLLEALPILSGARRFWSSEDVFFNASAFVFCLYFSALMLIIARAARRKRVSRSYALPWASLSLVLIFFLVVPVIFSLSSFGWLSRAPRYLLPLYSVLFLPIGAASETLWARSRFLGLLFPMLLLGVHYHSNFDGKFVVPGEPFVFRGARVARDHSELYQWLEKHQISHIRTNYWIGYRTAFETKERVTFSRFGRPRSLRIPEYELSHVLGDYEGVFVLSSGEAEMLKRELNAFGYSYKTQILSSYEVLYDARPKICVGKEISIDSSMIATSSQGEKVELMLDRDSNSRWGSAAPQQAGMFVEIPFSSPKDLSAVDLQLGSFIHDAPRGLVLEILDGQNKQWRAVFSTTGTKLEDDLREQEFSEVPETWRIHFSEKQVRGLRFRLTTSAEVFDWSIAELRLYQSCR